MPACGVPTDWSPLPERSPTSDWYRISVRFGRCSLVALYLPSRAWSAQHPARAFFQRQQRQSVPSLRERAMWAVPFAYLAALAHYCAGKQRASGYKRPDNRRLGISAWRHGQRLRRVSRLVRLLLCVPELTETCRPNSKPLYEPRPSPTKRSGRRCADRSIRIFCLIPSTLSRR